MKIIMALCFTLLLSTYANALEHGEAKYTNNSLQVWNENIKGWQSGEDFWLSYAQNQGGLTWPKSTTYPNYNDVKEFDTFLVQLKQGTCLMQFFHSRWRLANDVQRWNDKFNEYSGCPYVFD